MQTAVRNLLIIFLLMLQYALWIGDKNYFDLLQLNRSIEEIQLDNEHMHERNDRLQAKVIDLKKGGDAIEALARSELGYIKQGEIFYQVIEENSEVK